MFSTKNTKFPKTEKLKSQKEIENLFKNGRTISVFPIRIVYIESDFKENTSIKAGFSIGKKKFKKAVDRNRTKRLLREAYRLNKATYFNNITTQCALMILYIGDAKPDFNSINTKMKIALEQVSKAISK